MKILFVTSEAKPYFKTGGLGDVSRSLPDALQRRGHDVRICMPGYPAVFPHVADSGTEPALVVPWPGVPREVGVVTDVRSADNAPAVLLRDAFFDVDRPYHDDARDHVAAARRFALFSRAALAYARRWGADIMHLNDWQTGLVPIYGLIDGDAPPTVYAIHNLPYQGNVAPSLLHEIGVPAEFMRTENGLEFYGAASFAKAGIALSDRIVTVSPTYAREIQTPEFGAGLDGLLRFRRNVLHGILNGIDTETWDPRTDALIDAAYTAGTLRRKTVNRNALIAELGLDPQRPLVVMVSRLAHQKGIDLLLDALPRLMATDISLAILGDGDAENEHRIQLAALRNPGRIAARFVFDERLAHRLYAAGDFFLMPSLYEPCGLGQMIAQRYGTPPVVRRTGGLADTVRDGETGFTFDAAHPLALVEAVERAVERRSFKGWTALRQQCMRLDHSWDVSAGEYEDVYLLATAARRAA